MADEKHLEILSKGVEEWNRWRKEHPDVIPDLREANLGYTVKTGKSIYNDLSGINLSKSLLDDSNLSIIDFSNANFYESKLNRVDLSYSNLSYANLDYTEAVESDFTCELYNATVRNASLIICNFRGSNLSNTDFTNTNLSWGEFGQADISNSILINCNLTEAHFVDTNLEGACLDGSRIFGISSWRVNLANCSQNHLIITHKDEPTISVDDLEVAQFIYLIINNKKIKKVIDTLISKAVLIIQI